MKKLICICGILAMCLCLLAGCRRDLDVTVVSLEYDGVSTAVGTTQWKDKSIEISTEDMGLGKKKVYDFTGVKLSDLMEIAGAEDCTKAILYGSDGYSTSVPAEDIKNYDIALVDKYADGKSISTDAGGPLKLVFPVTDHPELKDTYDQWSWVWYVSKVEFVK